MILKIILIGLSFLMFSHSAISQRGSSPIDWTETRKEFINHSFIFHEIKKLNNSHLRDTISTKIIQFKSDSVFIVYDSVTLRGRWKNDHMDFYVIDTIGNQISYDFRSGSGNSYICFRIENNKYFIECYKKIN